MQRRESRPRIMAMPAMPPMAIPTMTPTESPEDEEELDVAPGAAVGVATALDARCVPRVLLVGVAAVKVPPLSDDGAAMADRMAVTVVIPPPSTL